jgi:hypothetical protein
MITVNSRLTGLALGLAVIAFASPSFAQRSEIDVYAARAAAIHACSVVAGRYTEYLWGHMEIYQYRACMAEHGQKE